MAADPMLLSVIIPIARNDGSWAALLPQLRQLPHDCEIILSGAIDAAAELINQPQPITIISCDKGRAAALNAGAAAANGKWLWFIHADSIISQHSLHCLLKALQQPQQQGLFYFHLRFHSDDAFLCLRMKMNSLGVTVRSHLLKSPFGDQAFCIDKKSFLQAGSYPENLAYGEDHAFVWQCHLADISVQSLPASISTSARKYANGGWFKISLLHNWLWFKQWLPLFFCWGRQKLWPR